MSHITKVKVKVTNLVAFGRACRDLGIEFVKDAKQFRWFSGRQSKCSHRIQLPGRPDHAYEIGLTSDGDGAFQLNYDDFEKYETHEGIMSKVSGKGGNNCGKLMQRYAYHAAKAEAEKNGWAVKEKELDDGRIQLSFATA